MTNSQNKTRQLGPCLVTGGSGFLGSNIAKTLLARGIRVTIFDRVAPKFEHENLQYIEGDITNKDSLLDACEGIDTIFHTAAIIELRGGPSMPDSYRQRSLEINTEGTKKLVAAAQEKGVHGIVYTSSNNVCYNGKPVTGLNSESPYATRLYDMYTESKMLAEKAVLEANGDEGILTAAIRPSGIYGAESCIMLDKFCMEAASGKIVVCLGSPNAVHENSFIDNLVHGHILAAERLVKGNRCCGRGYFISDHDYRNYFEFFRPMIEGLGYKFPKVWLPMGLLLPLMKLGQWAHFQFGTPAPLLSPKELDKVCVTHISCPVEPQQDLDYKPLITAKEAMDRCMPYIKQYHAELKAQ